MPFEWFVAIRYLREGRVQTLLILAAVSVGVSVIVFLSALINGLQTSLLKQTLGTQPHITLVPAELVARVALGRARAAVFRKSPTRLRRLRARSAAARACAWRGRRVEHGHGRSVRHARRGRETRAGARRGPRAFSVRDRRAQQDEGRVFSRLGRWRGDRGRACEPARPRHRRQAALEHHAG